MEIDPTSSEFDSKGTGSYLLADGEHIVMVSKAECDQRGGKDYVECDFECIGPVDPDKGKTHKWEKYFITEAAIWRYAHLCRAIDKTMRRHSATSQEDVDGLVYGQPLVVTLETYEDTWNGVTRTKQRVKFHRALTPDEEAALLSAYGRSLVPGGSDDNGNDSKVPF